MRFTFAHSHAFRGGRVLLDEDGSDEPVCVVEFGDGVTVIAEWRRAGDAIHLAVPAYRTAKDTEMAARKWIVAQRKDGVWRSQPASRCGHYRKSRVSA